MKLHLLFLGAIACTLSVTNPVFGAVIAEDSFQSDLSGGSGLDGSWSGADVAYTGAGLTYSDATSGNSLGSGGAATASEDRTSFSRSLTASATSATAESVGGTEIWFAWLGAGSSDASVSYTMEFEPSTNNTSKNDALLFQGAFGGGIDVATREWDTSLPGAGREDVNLVSDVGGTTTDGSANLFVGKLTLFDGQNDTLEFWMNPTLETAGPGDTGLGTYGYSGSLNIALDLDNIVNFQNRPQNGDRNDYPYSFDEFRIATSYEQAIGIPEPSAGALLISALTLGLAFRRRRAS